MVDSRGAVPRGCACDGAVRRLQNPPAGAHHAGRLQVERRGIARRGARRAPPARASRMAAPRSRAAPAASPADSRRRAARASRRSCRSRSATRPPRSIACATASPRRGRGSRAVPPSISVIDDSRIGIPHCSARAAALSGSRRSSVRRRSRSTSSREYRRSRDAPGRRLRPDESAADVRIQRRAAHVQHASGFGRADPGRSGRLVGDILIVESMLTR